MAPWRLRSTYIIGLWGVILWRIGAPWPLFSMLAGWTLAEVCRYLLESGRVHSGSWKRALNVTIWTLKGAVLCLAVAYALL